MSGENKVINGQNVTELLEFREAVRKDSSLADRNPTLIARWIDGSRSRVEFGDVATHLGGDGELNPMQMLLGSPAACDVDLVARHAAFLGLKIESLSVEASGHFYASRHIGLENAVGPGHDAIAYTVHLRAPGATTEQIAELRKVCERASPVGDSLARAIPLRLDVDPGSSDSRPE